LSPGGAGCANPDGGIYPQEAWAELWQGLGEETSVDIGLGEIVEIKMTPKEARRLAQHIMVVCDQALAESPAASSEKMVGRACAPEMTSQKTGWD